MEGANTNVNASSSTSRPNPDTQAARLLAALLSGQKLDPLTGWRRLGIYRLSDTVLQLRKLGWPVITGHLDVNNKFGETCHVALYYLPPEVISEAGQQTVESAACLGEAHAVHIDMARNHKHAIH